LSKIYKKIYNSRKNQLVCIPERSEESKYKIDSSVETPFKITIYIYWLAFISSATACNSPRLACSHDQIPFENHTPS
jgi:hypothetical protein